MTPKEVEKKIAQIDTRNKYEKSIEHMNEMLPYVIQEWDVKAKFLKKKHDRLIAEGFTEEQALEIVKTRPIFE
ncbi:hypothetical protein [Sporosarcina newyorkensis]|uniref:hypothetical protein n=1 Tax=Sporosarcina newyorkensis TaxID=759851 RepID=UPI00099A06A8|nr:hypothetical protein [Sporosarcina newyorkensis]